MERRRFPDRSGINAVVEEHDQRAPPVPPNRDRAVPASRALHLVSREVEGIDFRLGQIVSARHIALRPGLWESRRRVDQFLFPGPRNDGAQVFAGLVCGATGIRPFVCDRPVFDSPRS